MKLNNKGFGAIAVVLILVLAGALGFAGYRYTTNNDNPKTSTEQQTIEQKATPKVSDKQKETKGTIIKSGDSEYGTMLFDNNDQAIYIWELEETSQAKCYDDCAEAWPPVLTDGAPRAGGEVDAKLLGTTKRTDGTIQVTYNDHPLYYYAHEEAGEVKCHNISTHGGLWWVIQPNGSRAK